MTESQVDKIISLLESIDSVQKTLLKKQEEADAMMDTIASRFGAQGEATEEKEDKSTDTFYNQNLVKMAREQRAEATSTPW